MKSASEEIYFSVKMQTEDLQILYKVFFKDSAKFENGILKLEEGLFYRTLLNECFYYYYSWCYLYNVTLFLYIMFWQVTNCFLIQLY